MPLTDRRVVRLRGPESVAFLDSLVTNRVTGEGPCYAALLTPQGRVIAELFIVPAPEDGSLLLDVPVSQSEALATALARYRLRRAVLLEPTDLRVVVSEQPIAGGYPDPRLAALGWRGFDRTATEGDASAYAARCHAVGVPPHVPTDALPLEYNLDFLNGVSFTKGCYIGQEVTARMHHRHLVRKRLFAIDNGPEPHAFGLISLEAPDPALTFRRPAWMAL